MKIKGTILKGSVHCILIIFMSCSSGKIIIKTDDVKFIYHTPPGTVRIDTNYFADNSEITNIDYREYVYWNKKVFGEESARYQNALPDSLIWAYADSSFILPLLTYFRHPVYNDYPVMGVSYEQACDYAVWRSDRVMEYILIKNKLIDRHENQDSNNYFTAVKFMTGNYMNYKVVPKIPSLKYRLPTVEEWEKLAYSSSDSLHGLDRNAPKIKRSLKKGTPLFYTKEFTDFQKETGFNSTTFTREIMSFPPNSHGVHDLIGNVAEMTSEIGIAKGGSWMHSIPQSAIGNDLYYDKAENWLGFRCVCSWEY